MHRTVTLSLLLAACGVCGLSLVAQTPAADGDQEVHADLNQLMRGALYPAANVVFASQVDDPEELKKAFTGDPVGRGRDVHPLLYVLTVHFVSL
jgi:hypothetical protein